MLTRWSLSVSGCDEYSRFMRWEVSRTDNRYQTLSKRGCQSCLQAQHFAPLCLLLNVIPSYFKSSDCYNGLMKWPTRLLFIIKIMAVTFISMVNNFTISVIIRYLSSLNIKSIVAYITYKSNKQFLDCTDRIEVIFQ